jgi:hydrogenase nickel incorporation protein HypB
MAGLEIASRNGMTPLDSKGRTRTNDQAASANRKDFSASGTVAIAIVGPAGSGKTSIIEELMLRLSPTLRSAVIMCNPAADRQISRITRHGFPAVAIEADNLSAVRVREALPKLNLSGLGALFIEADANALNPGELDFGHHCRVGVFSAAGGDDKGNEFPFLVSGSNLILLNKVDLLSLVKFDLRSFSADIARIEPNLSIVQVSVLSGHGIGQLAEWTVAQRHARGNGSTSGAVG